MMQSAKFDDGTSVEFGSTSHINDEVKASILLTPETIAVIAEALTVERLDGDRYIGVDVPRHFKKAVLVLNQSRPTPDLRDYIVKKLSKFLEPAGDDDV